MTPSSSIAHELLNSIQGLDTFNTVYLIVPRSCLWQSWHCMQLGQQLLHSFQRLRHPSSLAARAPKPFNDPQSSQQCRGPPCVLAAL